MKAAGRARSLRPVKSNLDLMLGLRIAAFAAAAELPKRIKVLNWGENKTASGRRAFVGATTLASLSANQARHGFVEIALDYEHNTVPGTKAYRDSAEPRAVAAYGVLDVVQGEGIFFTPSRWTPSGEKNAFEFQDLSPAPATNAAGEVFFVHSVALCRQGDVEDLHFVTLSVGSGNQEAVMDYKSELLKLLNLDATATDADIGKAVAAVKPAPAPEPMTAKVTDLEGKVTALTADFAAQKAADLKRQRDAIVAQAARDGKVIPLTNEQVAAMDIAALSTMVEKLTVTVPLEKRTPAVEAMTAQGGSPAIAAYNAIKDPEERARFYSENRDKILGK
jgi:hypothetical protein